MRTTETRTVLAHTERGEWSEARSVVEGWLAATNCGIFNRPDQPPTAPSTMFHTPHGDVKDALLHARQRYKVFTTHHPIFGSKDRALYRGALHNLWNVISYYEQENP